MGREAWAENLPLRPQVAGVGSRWPEDRRDKRAPDGDTDATSGLLEALGDDLLCFFDTIKIN